MSLLEIVFNNMTVREIEDIGNAGFEFSINDGSIVDVNKVTASENNE